MDERQQAILIHVGVTVMVSMLCHFFSRQYLQASVNAAIVSNVIYQVVAFYIEGRLDKFALAGFVVGLGVSLLIALAIGALFWLFRKRRNGVSGLPIK